MNSWQKKEEVIRYFFNFVPILKKDMDISELQRIYAGHPNTKGLAALLEDSSVRTIFLGGLHASAAALFVSSFLRENKQTFVFVLGDLEEAGYFYHDLTQVNGDEHILFFPSSYRRAVKYGQKDAANEILRTEVLSRLQKGDPLCVVTYPEALAEKVVSQEVLMDKTLKLGVGEHVDTEFITEVLAGYGFEHVDYVYEPGQYAVRGSIIDVFSFASEYPYRIDFFGDEVDSIRTFEVENQLSKEKKQSIAIVPELTNAADKSGVSFFEFIPRETVLAMKDFLWVRERIQVVREEALSPQALAAYEGEKTELMNLELKLIDGAEFTVRALDFKRIEFGNKPTGTPQATLAFDTTVQPIFHKNFDLVSTSFTDYQKRGYTLYICTDSEKQAKRLKDIFEERGDHITFIPVNKTLHEGFTDNVLKSCFFTDHQIFDRFHKYNLRSDKARSGKVALTLKELSQFEPGDFVVHIDHGVGRFGGLVRIPNGNTTQELIKLIYQNEDVVFVSIHSLHKISKYKGKEDYSAIAGLYTEACQIVVRAGMVAALAVPVVFVSKFLAVLLLVAAVLFYRLGSMTLRKKIGARRARIELELPRFVANIEKTLPHSRDVLAMLESYRTGAGEEFGRELDITVADMRSGNDEAALTRLEARVGSSALSDVVRGLIGILHGEDNSVYWANLSLKFSETGRQNLREQAGKVPKRVRRLSLVLLGCFFLIYIVVIGEVLLNSLGGLFL